MTVQDLIEKLNLKILVEGAVMGNINSIAVATLADVSCIILVENAALDAEAKRKADMHGVTILQTEENSYSLAVKIHGLLA